MGTPLTRGGRGASHPNRLVLQGASQPKRRSWEDIQRSPGRAPGLFVSRRVVATPPQQLAVVARRGSGPVMRFPAREARTPAREETASSAASRAAHPAMIPLRR
jgi:hypothetical protein